MADVAMKLSAEYDDYSTLDSRAFSNIVTTQLSQLLARLPDNTSPLLTDLIHHQSYIWPESDLNKLKKFEISHSYSSSSNNYEQ